MTRFSQLAKFLVLATCLFTLSGPAAADVRSILAINCPHETRLPTLTGELTQPEIESCPQDANKNGADQVCYQTAIAARNSGREIAATQTLTPLNCVPPTNACTLDISFYAPKVAVVETISQALQVGDQVHIPCGFEKITRRIQWARCDKAAATTSRILTAAQQSPGRFSGMVAIDARRSATSSTRSDSTTTVSGLTYRRTWSIRLVEPGPAPQQTAPMTFKREEQQ